MTGFASNLFKALFKRKSTRLTTERRRPAVRRRAALGFEALDVRAVLSTVVPTTVADDVVVDGRVITGEAIETTEFNIRKLTGRTNYDAAGTGAHAGGGGGGAGKVSMRDFLFSRPSGATSLHSGGVNVGLGDGSVRFVSDSISLVAWATDQDLAGTSGSGDGSGGRGLGTVFYHLLPSSADATRSVETFSFEAFGGFNGGVSVGGYSHPDL